MSYLFAKFPLILLENPDVVMLPDSLWRRYIESIVVAKVADEDGFLPPLRKMAFMLRITPETLQNDLSRLAFDGLLELKVDGSGCERWYVTHFEETQRPVPVAARVANHRARARVKSAGSSGNTAVTERYTDKSNRQDSDLYQQHEGLPAPVVDTPPARLLLERCGVRWNRTVSELAPALPLSYVATVCRQAIERRPASTPGWIVGMFREGARIPGPWGTNMGADDWREWEKGADADELEYWQRPPETAEAAEWRME